MYKWLDIVYLSFSMQVLWKWLDFIDLMDKKWSDLIQGILSWKHIVHSFVERLKGNTYFIACSIWILEAYHQDLVLVFQIWTTSKKNGQFLVFVTAMYVKGVWVYGG